jgi:hypothetical protein
MVSWYFTPFNSVSNSITQFLEMLRELVTSRTEEAFDIENALSIEAT